VALGGRRGLHERFSRVPGVGPAGPVARLLDFRSSWAGEDRKETDVVEEGRHCVDHGKTHSAYRWYVRERRPAGPGENAGQVSAQGVDYLCNAAYSRLPQAEQAEWKPLE